MQAVILAAGKSTRTYPLTLTKPKPLLKVAGKTIIEHNLEQLIGIVDEVCIVVGYKAEMIREFVGDEFKGMKIKYAVQKKPLGNADALLKAEKQIKEKFILMFGDDLYSGKDIKKLLKYDNAILAQRVENPERFGVLKIKDGVFVKVVEKPKIFISDLVNIGCFLFTKDIFQALKKIKLSKRNEYELPDAYNLLAKEKEINVVTVKDYWLPITYPWSLLEANEYLLKNPPNHLLQGGKFQEGKIEEGVKINGQLAIGGGTIIKSGVYIEGNVIIGKNCRIGPNCYLRGTTAIGDNCHIGQAVEIKSSIIGDCVNIAHLSYFGDSVIGDNVNIAAGNITANLRFDNKNIKSPVNGDVQDTKRRKLGVIIGDNCKTGINISFYPGVKINPGSEIIPGKIVKRDIK
ncbi:MAG: bifunctional sugar-1-phosphate nucleotidylyltransferase/acetyltransferase [Patescibacteria group bacterium]|nr:bifunctional sugar-1-phosphate nucleotidylyltransferase/acetyltransferase [Patescibacteria group bacterium]